MELIEAQHLCAADGRRMTLWNVTTESGPFGRGKISLNIRFANLGPCQNTTYLSWRIGKLECPVIHIQWLVLGRWSTERLAQREKCCKCILKHVAIGSARVCVFHGCPLNFLVFMKLFNAHRDAYAHESFADLDKINGWSDSSRKGEVVNVAVTGPSNFHTRPTGDPKDRNTVIHTWKPSLKSIDKL